MGQSCIIYGLRHATCYSSTITSNIQYSRGIYIMAKRALIQEMLNRVGN